MTRAFDLGHVAPSEIVIFLVATAFASLGLDSLLPRVPHTRAWAWSSAYIPLAIWVLAVRLVPADFATCGVLCSLLLTVTIIGTLMIARPAR